MQKIVTTGGGTGHYQILRGLKNYDYDLTAIVSMADDGGSSGDLRDEFGVLPPGDLIKCLIALSDESNVLRNLFEYRFDGKIEKHSLGNLIITALEKITGNYATAVKEAGKLLRIRGKVIPVSIDDFHIYAKLENGNLLKGQTKVSYPTTEKRITKVFPKPIPHVYYEAAQNLREANKIVICPGDLYGSVIPNFLVKGVKEAIADSKANLIYICNLVTKQGNYRYKVKNFVEEIESYLGKKLDRIIINTKKPSKKTLEKYLDEKSELVQDDLMDERVIRAKLVKEYPSERKTILRHDPQLTAQLIVRV